MATEVHNPTVQTQPLDCARSADTHVLLHHLHISLSHFWGWKKPMRKWQYRQSMVLQSPLEASWPQRFIIPRCKRNHWDVLGLQNSCLTPPPTYIGEPLLGLERAHEKVAVSAKHGFTIPSGGIRATEVHNPTVQTQPLDCARSADTLVLLHHLHISLSHFWGWKKPMRKWQYRQSTVLQSPLEASGPQRFTIPRCKGNHWDVLGLQTLMFYSTTYIYR